MAAAVPPVVSANQSLTVQERPGVKDWWISSEAPKALTRRTAIQTRRGAPIASDSRYPSPKKAPQCTTQSTGCGIGGV